MQGITLSHYSEHADLVPHSVNQDPEGRGDKPNGLWVSVDGPDDWREWCEGNDFGCLDHRFMVTLAEDANLLVIPDLTTMQAFTAEFRIPDRYGSLGISSLSAMLEDRDIDWSAVAGRWQGILIPNYLRSYSFYGHDVTPFWYWGWDCTSGCIWDASAIASVELVTA